MEKPKFKITFAPGAFDDFEGTQEELDEFVKEITKIIEDSEFYEGYSEVEIDAVELNLNDVEDSELQTQSKRIH